MAISKKFVFQAVITAIITIVSLVGSGIAQARNKILFPEQISVKNLEMINTNKEVEKETKKDKSEVKIPACGESIIDRDGYEYKTIQIGDQCWLKENLKTKTKTDGTCINGGNPPCADASAADNGKGRACYNNDEANCEAEGALYTYSGIGGSITTPGVQGICPDGWHIPTQNELTTLERSVCTSGTCETDFPYDTSTYGARGTDEGLSLQPGGCSGFDAKMTGRREANGSTFAYRGAYTWLWSSQYSIPSIHRRMLAANTGQIYRDAGNLSFNRSQSLRCVRDIPVPSFCGETITDRDGYTYKTVRIGDQCWMAEGLRTKTKTDGTCINGGKTPCADASLSDNNKGRSCYGNDEANCALYGALYTYSGIGGSITTPGVQGICPDGWHIPTQNELTTLERSVCTSGTCETDFPYDTSTYGLRGTNEGTRLKEGGCSRFNAKMTGRREADGVTFTALGDRTWLWSSQYSIPSIHRRMLTSDSSQIYRDAGNLSFDRSQTLRCLKN